MVSYRICPKVNIRRKQKIENLINCPFKVAYGEGYRETTCRRNEIRNVNDSIFDMH